MAELSWPQSAVRPFRPVKLGETMRLAIENSAQLKKAKLDRAGLESRLREGRASALPQISTSLQFDYFPVLPTQFLPGELFGQSAGAFIPATFGQPWQMTAALNAQQPLYNESKRRGAAAREVSRALYDLLVERSEEEVRYNTAQVFYQTLQTQLMLRSMDANLEKLAALQRMAELQLSTGFATPTDVKRIRVAKTNLETTRQNLLTAISALRQTLQFLCGVPVEEPFDPFEIPGEPAADSLKYLNIFLETESTTEFRLLQQNMALNRIQTRSLLAENRPTLNAYATGFYQAQRIDANVFDGNNRWYGMAAFGLKAQAPLFDGFRRKHRAGLLRIELLKMEEDRRQLFAAKTLEFGQAREQLINALRALRTQSDNVGLAREIVEKLTLQYKEGVAPLTDLLNAQTALSEAETNYWQQVFTYKLAVLKLLKAAGRLDELE